MWNGMAGTGSQGVQEKFLGQIRGMGMRIVPGFPQKGQNLVPALGQNQCVLHSAGDSVIFVVRWIVLLRKGWQLSEIASSYCGKGGTFAGIWQSPRVGLMVDWAARKEQAADFESLSKGAGCCSVWSKNLEMVVIAMTFEIEVWVRCKCRKIALENSRYVILL
eukprot:TRINITY_DN12977_c0_g2_i1.p1 TRINITY_DN12977_c0_g2~~TRINITY_DN12977_c0_g2_i1.p1  ORF type:complete len:163 (+),score=24.26 TRINITY_DN12977_c0_g2_i1:213-701(+)